VQFHCDHCGETLTFVRDHPRIKALEENDMCRQCLQGKIVKIIE
jgi:hypothetical protein